MLDLELVFGQTLIGGFDIVSGGGDGQVVAEVGQQPDQGHMSVRRLVTSHKAPVVRVWSVIRQRGCRPAKKADR